VSLKCYFSDQTTGGVNARTIGACLASVPNVLSQLGLLLAVCIRRIVFTLCLFVLLCCAVH
jgi:hypothetical protein